MLSVLVAALCRCFGKYDIPERRDGEKGASNVGINTISENGQLAIQCPQAATPEYPNGLTIRQALLIFDLALSKSNAFDVVGIDVLGMIRSAFLHVIATVVRHLKCRKKKLGAKIESIREIMKGNVHAKHVEAERVVSVLYVGR